MKCERCGGLMLMEQFYDFRDDTAEFEFSGWRCLVCGEIVDPLLVGNLHGSARKEARRPATLFREYAKLDGRLSSLRVPLKRITQGRQEGRRP